MEIKGICEGQMKDENQGKEINRRDEGDEGQMNK